MACSLKLVRLDDFAADVDELDLLSSGFDLADDGYLPVAAPLEALVVDEVITLKITGTSKDDLADNLHDLEDKIRQVRNWLVNQPVEKYSVWLRAQLNNESLPRQAMLTDIMPPQTVRVFNPMEKNANYVGEYSVGITRSAYWEDPYTYPTTTSKTGINCIGGTVELSETIEGDVAARLARFDLKCGTDGDEYGKFWIGWRTARLSAAPGAYQSVWSLDNGTVETDTSIVADATAYSGNRLTCTFGTVATLAERVYLRVSDVTGNPEYQVGRAVVLLRAKMSDTSVARVRAKFGWVSTTTNTLLSPQIMSRQVISGTAWAMYEMGAVNMPPIRNTAVTLENFGIALDAERISGAGALYLDCLVLIPASEGFARITTASNIEKSGGSLDSATILMRADGQLSAMKIGAVDGLSYDSANYSQSGWGLPVDGSIESLAFPKPYLYLCAGSTTGVNVKNDTLQMSYVYIPRWRVLRGNET